MQDFLGNELHVGDFCVYIKNRETGSSTVRKVMQKGNITRFTKKMVVIGYVMVSPKDTVKIQQTGGENGTQYGGT